MSGIGSLSGSMSGALASYGRIAGIGQQPAASKPAENPVEAFGAMVQSTASSLHSAEAETAKQLAGQGNMVDLVTAISAAELAMESMAAVRDRVVSAYGDIMRMQV